MTDLKMYFVFIRIFFEYFYKIKKFIIIIFNYFYCKKFHEIF